MGISGLVAGSWQLRGLTGFFRVMAPEGSEKVGQLKVLQVALLQGVIKVFSHPEAGATGGQTIICPAVVSALAPCAASEVAPCAASELAPCAAAEITFVFLLCFP